MDDYDGADAIERAWRDGLKPDPLLTVSEWADRYRVLSQRASSEPGRWRTERTPYLKGIMDCLSPASPVQRVALMKGAQIGGTECGNCWIGYPTIEERKRVRTTSAIERRFREVRRRIRPMGTFQDRTSMERILFAVFMHENRNQGLATPFALT